MAYDVEVSVSLGQCRANFTRCIDELLISGCVPELWS
uniref:Uncharacterized protein n=1 Tax=Anguilla anguilla TaxID=7936 RepID=A0A0E9TTN9_ANGAN